MDLVIVIHEFREDLSVISEVVNKGLEGLSVSVEEYSIVNLLEIMHSIEHLFEG